MEIIVKLAVFELLFGLALSMYNLVKKKDYVALLGEHGIGMVLYVLAIYFVIGPGFTPSIGPLSVQLLEAGLLCSFAEPIIHSLVSHHFSPMESISEGIGGLLMTFVEGLGNMFSFLRVAAFAVAHASLAVAATALGITMGPAVGLVIMNVIAMTFEFISSSVQSMRLLYYEFMGKFFDGQGVPFRPFKIPAARRLKE
jgi:V/A-type H+-transporting ATPase subunit I